VNKAPFLIVKSLEKADLDSWPQLVSILSNAQGVESQQAWRSDLEPGFRPMRVKTGWTRDALYVHAEIEDADIFNPEKKFNALSFTKGDVFEIFLRPCDQDAYFEFHVTPENQKLQLRFPSSAALVAPRAQPGLPPEWFISHPVIESRVRINTATQRWEVAAEIPFDLVCETSQPRRDTRWLFSFSRYDYTRGQERPILSSTSPHKELNFHRQEAWGELRFM
jgi:hypothetical protein